MTSEISVLHLTKLSSILLKSSKDHFNKKSVCGLKELARNSVDINTPILSLKAHMAMVQILFFITQMESVEKIKDSCLKLRFSITKSPWSIN